MSTNIVKTLHDSSMLAYITIRVWSARKLDKKATRRLTDENAASADAARVNKYLLASADSQLKDIQRIARRARDVFYDLTLPWSDAGERLLSNLDTFKLIGEMHAIEQEFNAAVDAFCVEYPKLREVSLLALGDMANNDDYPSEEVVRTKFGIRTTLSPLPEGFSDERVGLTPEQQDALRVHYETQAAERFEDAMTAAWTRLRDNVARYEDRLALTEDGKNKAFQATMVSQLRDTMELLKNLNVFNTPELIRFQFQIEQTLCKHDPDVLRNSITTAQSAQQSASTILHRLNAMLEG